MPGNVADVSATELPLTYRISLLSFPLKSCRSWIQKIIPLEKCATHCIGSDSSGAGIEESRYVNSSFVVGTSASSPGVLCHLYI